MHQFEKEVMRDAFEQDAYEGLSRLNSDEAQADLQFINDRFVNANRKRKSNWFRYAAIIILLLGLPICYYLIRQMNEQELMITENVQHSLSKESGEPEEIADIEELDYQINNDTIDDLKLDQNKNIIDDKIVTSTIIEKKEVEAENKKSGIFSKTRKKEQGLSRNPLGRIETLELKRNNVEILEPNIPDLVIKGRVVDNEGVPLPGVSVTIKGTEIRTLTDMNGNYTIITKIKNVKVRELIYRFIGYQTQNIRVADDRELNVKMEESAESLNEVVVTGYSKTNRNTYFGNVSKPKSFSGENKKKGGAKAGAEGMEYSDSSVFRNNNLPDSLSGRILLSFKKDQIKQAILDNVDYSLFKDCPGKYRIVLIYKVNRKGEIQDLKIKNAPHKIFEDEIRKIMARMIHYQEKNAEVEKRLRISLKIFIK